MDIHEARQLAIDVGKENIKPIMDHLTKRIKEGALAVYFFHGDDKRDDIENITGCQIAFLMHEGYTVKPSDVCYYEVSGWIIPD